MDEKQPLSPGQIQEKLKNLQKSAGHHAADRSEGHDVEITVASQREAFDLKACQLLLEENGIVSRRVGRGFNQVLVVSRKDSSQAINVITANRARLLRTNPLTAGDYVVGVVAWSLGWGLFLPGLGLWFLMKYEADAALAVIVVPVLAVCSLVLGGFLGYLRCRAIASRRRK